MAIRELTMERFEEIKRMLESGVSARKIAATLKCSRHTVKKIKTGEIILPKIKPDSFPVWTGQLDWDEISKIKEKHYFSNIWEEYASHLTSYSNFCKQFYRKFPEKKGHFVTHRYFEPGSRCEVDYAGQTIEWVSPKTGEVNKAPVFISALCFSQRIFAQAKANMKSPNFLDCHRLMFESFGGSPEVTVPDNLKQGVDKYHLYDPDINKSYTELAKHYNTVIVPARVRKPKDKPIVEGAVKIVMRYFNYVNRNKVFLSIAEINKSLEDVVAKINSRVHTRLKKSRNQMWEESEKAKLHPLPVEAFEYFEWKEAKVHPDSHVRVGGNYYSVPHAHRGRKVKTKQTKDLVEVYFNLDRIAVHPRHKRDDHKIITEISHLPANARAYHEATPQNVLSQAKFISVDLYSLIDDLFSKSALGNLRRAQGLISQARKEIESSDHDLAKSNIARACEEMTRFSRIRVPYFRELLSRYRKERIRTEDREIKRVGSNPMLRHHQTTNNVVDMNKTKEVKNEFSTGKKLNARNEL